MARPIVERSGLPHNFRDCDSELIHLSGSIQPLGDLIVVNPSNMEVVQAAIAPSSGLFSTSPVSSKLADALPEHALALQSAFSRLSSSHAIHLGLLRANSRSFDAIGHRSGQVIVLEFEETNGSGPGSFDDVYPQIRGFLDQLQSVEGIEDASLRAAKEVRKITGLDRALVYRFDYDWNGEVIAEDRNDRLPSYLGLRFPASDIPAQARELYRKNRLRLIASSDYKPIPILPAANPIDGSTLDLSLSVLRSVSPVHLQYMRNMETAASMSISLLRGDRLWGLISCHGAEPARVPYHVRNGCDFIGQVLSLQLAAMESAALADRRHDLRNVQRRLLSSMAAADHFIDGLTANPSDLLALAGAAGAAVIVEGSCKLVGETPSNEEVQSIVAWLSSQSKGDIYESSHLAAEMPEAETLKDTASGILAIAISQIHESFLIWFRPELLKTIAWGGDPTKRIEPGSLQIHPRASFETWQETVRHQSAPWHEAEVDASAELRTAIVDIVLRKAEELAALSEQLTESNKELEAFSYSVSHDLRAPFRHIVGYAQLLKKLEKARFSEKGARYVDTIIESAISAGTLVDNLLSFSQMGRSTMRPVEIDISEIVEDVRRRMAPDEKHAVNWRIGELPRAIADPTMLRLVFQNLLENAVKFSRGREPAIIEVGYARDARGGAYFVRDNGTGFDMAYVGKLFGVFQRLHRTEDFEGTGIGLANVKRIIDRHDGKVWAEGKLGEGATIYFSLPSSGA
jgi:light-regulated signal transduction histidine kinase (bacteriophytochrome)